MRIRNGFTPAQDLAYRAALAFDANVRCRRMYHTQDDWDVQVRQAEVAWVDAMRKAVAEYDQKFSTKLAALEAKDEPIPTYFVEEISD